MESKPQNIRDLVTELLKAAHIWCGQETKLNNVISENRNYICATRSILKLQINSGMGLTILNLLNL